MIFGRGGEMMIRFQFMCLIFHFLSPLIIKSWGYSAKYTPLWFLLWLINFYSGWLIYKVVDWFLYWLIERLIKEAAAGASSGADHGSDILEATSHNLRLAFHTSKIELICFILPPTHRKIILCPKKITFIF